MLKSFVMLYKLKKSHLKSSEKAKMFCQIKHLNVIIKYLFDQFSITCRLWPTTPLRNMSHCMIIFKCAQHSWQAAIRRTVLWGPQFPIKIWPVLNRLPDQHSYLCVLKFCPIPIPSKWYNIKRLLSCCCYSCSKSW